MNFWRSVWIVARRDVTALVLTPTFLVFLLAPLLMLGFGALGGASASAVAASAENSDRIVAYVPAAERDRFIAADQRLRRAWERTPPITVVPQLPEHAGVARELTAGADVLAVLTGPAAAPRIAERNKDGSSGRYLALLAETVAREGARATAPTASRATFVPLARDAGNSRSARQALGYGAVFALFMLLLLLAGQTVGTMAEEKGNKVLEILAAAIPLEALFFGKLIGMFAVAMLFVAFWGLVGAGALSSAAGVAPELAARLSVVPAIGWPMFVLLTGIYFFLAFLLLGAMFLSAGALASTVREIQMLSLPLTFLQVGVFALASAAANAPGSGIATVAQWVPWASPLAMSARAATDASLAPHLVAILWQLLWVTLTIWLGVRVFRAGVLRSSSSGGGWLSRLRRSQPETPVAR